MANKNMVNIDVNPCKMCMPMGGVMAFKGIENNMIILHGSQGCSTYIRRHMATHYNEPVDIASSALTENGTVYGGAENLKKGLKNMIKMYTPSTIGVMTTCLAETIGEDVNRIISEFCEEEKEIAKDIKIISVPTPGYGGTQFEGYYLALRKIVEKLCTKKCVNFGGINVICANLNPGDVRNIKEILNGFGMQYTILPDVSNTLDSPHNDKYLRIPKGGTKIEDIKRMSGAIATIEMGMTIDEEKSPGAYLRDSFGVPLYKCGIPIGIRNTEEFIKLISEVSGISIPKEFIIQRGRYLDGMIDNHKYTGKARVIIYGEPELALAAARTCLENGVLIKLVALGAKNSIVKSELMSEMKSQKEAGIILDDTDFDTIEEYAKKFNVNLLIGNSDGRRMAKRLGIKIIRIGFPVHDRVGAQRKIITGYNGSASFIDDIANSMLEITENTFRKKAFDNYYVPTLNLEKNKNLQDKTCTHPCFSDDAHKFARMHIPVAPKCNISCNYCSRKYDCVNESRPGVTSEVLSPVEALEKFKLVKSKMKNLTVLGIAGPGDALANFEETKKTLKLIKKESPEMTFCLSTNGLMLPFYADELISLGVSHVTVTINAVDKKIGAKIYREVNYLENKYVGEEGAEILLNNQITGLKYLCSKGIVCKVNIVMLKGINDQHISEVVRKVKACGAYMTNIMQMIPVKGSVFEKLPLVTKMEIDQKRKECEAYIKQMYHCRQCRADAIGTLAQDCSIDFRGITCRGECQSAYMKVKEKEIETSSKVYKFAISSRSGINVDQHFGHAAEFYIYTYNNGKIRFLEKRNVEKYCTGILNCYDHEDKISKTIKAVNDCDAVLALRVGLEPRKKLEKAGIRIIEMYEPINNGVKLAVEKIQLESREGVIND